MFKKVSSRTDTYHFSYVTWVSSHERFLYVLDPSARPQSKYLVFLTDLLLYYSLKNSSEIHLTITLRLFLDTHCFTCLDGAKLEMKVFCQINTKTIPSPKKRRRNSNLAYFTKCERHFDIWPLEITVKLVRVGKVGRLKSVFVYISIIKKRKVVTKNISYLIWWKVCLWKERCFFKLSYRKVVLCDSQLASDKILFYF